MAALEFAATRLATLKTGCDPQPVEQPDSILGPDRQIRILSVSPDEEDHAGLFQILGDLPFLVTVAWTCREAGASQDSEPFDIILCERNLPDGSWLEILDRISGAADKPLLIVTSRLADACLWAEVLNLGGYDLLAKPFSRQEVRHVLTSAWVQRANPVRRTCVA
jgi:DNA-binding response OmpR family regulator